MFNFQFLIGLQQAFAKLHFAENPVEIEQPVQKIQQLKSFQNIRKQKEILPLFGYISKSIFQTSD